MSPGGTQPVVAPKRLLIRGPNWVGDAVMSTPALIGIRERLPQTHITLLVPSKLDSLFHGHPAVDTVLSLPANWGLLKLAGTLRNGNYDAALILPNSERSALEIFFARIPVRIGIQRGWRNFLLTRSIPERAQKEVMHKRGKNEIKRRLAAANGARTSVSPSDPSVHQVNDYLHLAAGAFECDSTPISPQLFVSDAEIQKALEKYKLIQPATFVGINPGAEYGPAKRWPPSRFIGAAQALQKEVHPKFLIFGGKRDIGTCSEIASAINAQSAGSAVNLSGRTTLRELMALLKSCRVVLTNDTGPMHVAAALGTPVVVPFGSTLPDLTGPLPVSAHSILRVGAPCSPCYLRECPVDFRCMYGIQASDAAAAALKILSRQS